MTLSHISTPVPVTVYGKPSGCGQCIATTKHLDRQGTPYAYRDVTTDPAAADEVRALGYVGVPVVVAGDMHWHGYRDQKLNQLGRAHTFAPDITSLDEQAATYLEETA